MRVFAALRPPPEVLAPLEAALEEVRSGSGLSLRWVDPAQWHLTLAFRGDLPEGALPDTIARMAEIAAEHSPLALHLSGAGVFSGRTLWIGVGGQTSPLRALMGEPLLGDGTGEEFRGADRRPGHAGRERRRAHLTVARLSSRAPRPPRRRRRGEPPAPDPTHLLLAEATRALSVYRGPSWQAQEIELLLSHLGEGRSGGPRHERLAAAPLGG